MTFSPTDAARLVREAREDQRIEYHLPDDRITGLRSAGKEKP
jgi:hypothetical protein